MNTIEDNDVQNISVVVLSVIGSEVLHVVGESLVQPQAKIKSAQVELDNHSTTTNSVVLLIKNLEIKW